MESSKRWLYRLTLVAGGAFIVFSLVATLRSEAADLPGKAELALARRVVGTGEALTALPAPGLLVGHGIVEPKDRETALGSQLAGLVHRVRVKEGERVERGAVLFELVADAEAADVKAREADLAVARARVALSTSSARRAERLVAGGATTAEEQERATAQQTIDTASVGQAEARLAEARARLGRLTVRAPFAGTVLRVLVREGEFYNPSAGALATLGDLSRIRVRLDVDERQVSTVALGQRASVTAMAFSDQRFEATVVELALRMGRKNLRTDEPTERIDTTIREVVLELEDGRELVQGLRVVGVIETATPTPPKAPVGSQP